MEDEVKNSSVERASEPVKGTNSNVGEERKSGYDRKRCISVQLKSKQLEKIGTLASIFEPLVRESAPASTLGTQTKNILSRAAYSKSDYITLSPTGDATPKFSEDDRLDTEHRHILTLATDEERENAQRELYDLINDHDYLKALSLEQQNKIVELETHLEDLEEELQLKRSNTAVVNEHRLLLEGYEEKSKRVTELDTYNRLLALEVTQLREELESLDTKGHHSHLPGKGFASQLLTGFIKDNEILDEENDLQMKALGMEIQNLQRVIQQKDNQIQKLVLELEARDVRRLTVESALDNHSKLQNKYESRLRKVSVECEDLRDHASKLEYKLQNTHTVLQVLEQKLAEEQEVGRIAEVERERMRKKLQDMAAEKKRQNVTFMNLFDELNVDGEEFKEEGSPSGTHEDDAFSYETATEREEDGVGPVIRFSSKRSSRTTRLSKMEALTPAEKERRLQKAAEEFFLMTTISVRMNLAEFYEKDEIMTADMKELWKRCLGMQVPMHKYYLFVEVELRRDFNLPDLAFRLNNPKKSPYCSIM